MDFLQTYWEYIVGGGGIVFLILAAIVALTERKDDDAALREFLGSPLVRRLATTGALATATALAGSLLGGCAGRAAVALEAPRAAGCVAAETACVDRAEDGDMALAAARACVYGVRLACDEIRDRILSPAAEGGE